MPRKPTTTRAFGVKKRHAKKRGTSTGRPKKHPDIAIDEQVCTDSVDIVVVVFYRFIIYSFNFYTFHIVIISIYCK